MRIDFPELEKLNAQARKERAEAIYGLLIAPVVRFFTARATRKPRTRTHQGHAAA
jgi:hypothetical protein